MAKDKRANVKLSKKSLHKLQNLKKNGESYNKMIDRLHNEYCGKNPSDRKCPAKFRGED